MIPEDRTKMIGRISQLLFDDWDPIGIKEVAGPAHHYKRYAKDIAKLLTDGAGKQELVMYLDRAYIRCLGTPDKSGKLSINVSEKIFSILGNVSDRNRG